MTGNGSRLIIRRECFRVLTRATLRRVRAEINVALLMVASRRQTTLPAPLSGTCKMIDQ